MPAGDRLQTLGDELDEALLPLELDMRVNNVGLALGLEPSDHASQDDWQTMIGTNCTGLVKTRASPLNTAWTTHRGRPLGE